MPEQRDRDAATAPAADALPAADDVPLTLEPLTAHDRAEAALAGELGCAFSSRRGADPVFIGMGFVGPGQAAQGLVRLAGAGAMLTMTGTGGYDRMADGARFVGDELAVEIRVTGEQPLREDPPIAGESPVYEAKLVATSGMQTTTIAGFWECGP